MEKMLTLLDPKKYYSVLVFDPIHKKQIIDVLPPTLGKEIIETYKPYLDKNGFEDGSADIVTRSFREKEFVFVELLQFVE